MSQAGVRQVILAGEVLSLRMGQDAGDFDAIENYARSVIERLVKLDSPEVKKQILLAVLVLASEVVKLRGETNRLQKSEAELEHRLAELCSLIQETMDNSPQNGALAAEFRTPTL
jgi:hypothetical protein